MGFEPRVALVFKDFAYWTGASTVGLNIALNMTAAVLRNAGIEVTVFAVHNNVELFEAIRKYNKEHPPLTHVVIGAPWLSIRDLRELVKYFADTQFLVQSHANVGFLHADSMGIYNLRGYIDLTYDFPNLTVGGNCAGFVDWLSNAYGYPQAVLLPNLYEMHPPEIRKFWDGRLLKVGIFGAVRLQKNFLTAVAAAVLLQAELDTPVEIHISTGGETDGGSLMKAIDQMVVGIPGLTLVKHRWLAWGQFMKVVAKMDLLLQPSYSESFNLVTADGIVNGVPSVVSPVIKWAPEQWKADPDSASSLAERAVWILAHSPSSIGWKALEKYNQASLARWRQWLGIPAPKKHWHDAPIFWKALNWLLE